MRVKHTIFALPLVAALAAGCGSDTIGPSDLQLSDLVGTWTVTKIEYTSDANRNTKRDLIADNGATGTITVSANGTYTYTLTAPGPITQTTTGTFTVQNGNVIDSPTGQTPHTTVVSRTGDTVTIVDESVTFDFDNNSATPPTAADVTIVWKKQS
jgi:VCBS repeat-containing protein